MKSPITFCFTLSAVVCALSFSFSCHPAGIPDTQLGNWVQAAPIGAYPRSNSACFVIGDHAYVGLGFNENIGQPGRLTDFWTFCVDSGWTQVASFTGAPRSNAAAFTIGNYGYVGTGWDSYNVFNDFYQYDPQQNVWAKKADFPGGPRYDAVGFGVQGKGYLGTGFNVYWLNDFYQYDPVQDKWSLTPGTSGNFSKRRAAVAFTYRDQAYIVTGSNSGGMVRDFWRFDPSQQEVWHQLADITNTNAATFDDGYSDIEREYATAFVNGSQAYLTTGMNTSMVTSTWAYDIGSDRWSRRTGYPREARSGAVSFTVSGQSFLGSGNTGSNTTFDDFDEFQPTVPFNSNDF
jgi:N-acetylneuraminic acid mutarotase